MTGGATTRRAALGGIAACLAAGHGPAFARERLRAKVAVVGAGLAGLETALRLEAEGVEVLVLEGSGRVGGRLRSLESLPGTPNVGGVQIGASYARLKARAQTVGIALEPEPMAPRASRLYLPDAAPIDPAGWADSPLNPFPGAFRQMTPGGALFALAGGRNPLSSVDDWRGPAGTAADVSAAEFLTRAGFSPEARALVDRGLNGNDLSSYSMLNVWRSLRLFEADRAAGPSLVVPMGSERLPRAMARALRQPVRTGFPVRSVMMDRRGARIISTLGDEVRAEALVMALPFPALRRIEVTAPMNPETREAIAELPYTQIIQIVVEPAIRYWERDGLPLDMWCDGPLERVFSIRTRAGADTGLLMVWLNGTGAQALDRAAFEAGSAAVRGAVAGLTGSAAEAARAQAGQQGLNAILSAEFARLRPASEGKLRVRHVQSWTALNTDAGGAYMHWAPGQAARWAGRMGAPAGRMVFAGEHLGLVHTGMEAAFESAERAAADVLAALRRPRA